MIKISVSQAARMLCVSRTNLQKKISGNKINTHEGYLTMQDIKLAYPDFTHNVEQDLLIKKSQAIKENATKRKAIKNAISEQNQILIDKKLTKLQQQLIEEFEKNQKYQKVLTELVVKLNYLERHCHSEDKHKLHVLQNWLKNKRLIYAK